MATGLIQLGNWLLLAGALLFIVAVFNALRAGRQLRNAAYYAVRQEALSRTRRWAFLAAIALLATGGLAIYLSNLPAPTAVASRWRRRRPSSSMCPAACCLPPPPHPALPARPARTPISNFDSDAQRRLLPPPTATLPPNLPGILRTPVPSAVPVSPNAKLTFTTLASVVDNKGTPSDPGLAFPAGTRSVRLFFQAANVNNGAAWSVLCYKGNNLVDSVHRSVGMGTACPDGPRLLRHRRLTGQLQSGRLPGTKQTV